LAVVLIALAVVGLVGYRRARAGYDAYRARIQPGITIAGLDVGWRTPEEARSLVMEQIARPYYQDFSLSYQDQELTLAPEKDLSLHIDVAAMVDQAVQASHQTDYWQGFREWLKGEVVTKTVDVPLKLSFDPAAAAVALTQVAKEHDQSAVEPMVDIQKSSFIPGKPGRRLEVEKAAQQINLRVPDPRQRDLALPVTLVEPDQSTARIESMLSTLGPVMDLAPVPPSFYTATLPLSTTGGLAGTPLVTYTGELTWTFPYFSSYQGPLTSTYGFFFDPGTPGARFDVERAIQQVEAALQSGVTSPIRLEATPVAPPPVTRDLLIPPLEARLARFPGIYSLVVKNLDTGEVIYDHNTKIVLSGMSVVKIGIMVEVYRASKGAPDQQTRQELGAMLGSSSCNPCANRLMAAVGDGSATAGAQRVTHTMAALGLSNFRLCGPYHLETSMGSEGGGMQLVSRVPVTLFPAATGLAPVAARLWMVDNAGVPGYDRCVHATPHEMADLLEMIYLCTQDKGKLHATYPAIFAAPVCQEMIDIMAANDLRNMLGAGIPAEVKLAHKHGFAGYDAPWGDTRAEVGIVFSPGATWLVSFYIWQDSPWIDFGVVQPLYRDVSNLLYNYFNPANSFWPLPPWSPSPPVPGMSSQVSQAERQDWACN
jgi:hypothetical protein